MRRTSKRTECASSLRCSSRSAGASPRSLSRARARIRCTEKRRFNAESGFWKTICRARTSSRPRSVILASSACPSSSMTDPSSAWVRPSRVRASVVLPLPDSPTSPSVSPGFKTSEMSSTARTSWPSWRKVLLTPSARTTGCASSSAARATGMSGVARGNDCACSWKWQRLCRLGPSSMKSGSFSLQMSWASPQRSTNTHAGRSAPSWGRNPGIVSRRCLSLRTPPRGRQRSSPTV